MSTPATAHTTPNGVALTFRPEGADALAQHLAVMVGSGGARYFDDLYGDIGEYLLGEIQDNFDHQRLADGGPMPQSAAAIARTGKTLIDKHHLYDSYAYQTEQHGVAVGSPLAYARIHHFGGETGRAGHRFEMEARPVMGIGDEQEDHIGQLVLDELARLQPRAAQ